MSRNAAGELGKPPFGSRIPVSPGVEDPRRCFSIASGPSPTEKPGYGIVWVSYVGFYPLVSQLSEFTTKKFVPLAFSPADAVRGKSDRARIRTKHFIVASRISWIVRRDLTSLPELPAWFYTERKIANRLQFPKSYAPRAQLGPSGMTRKFHSWPSADLFAPYAERLLIPRYQPSSIGMSGFTVSESGRVQGRAIQLRPARWFPALADDSRVRRAA